MPLTFLLKNRAITGLLPKFELSETEDLPAKFSVLCRSNDCKDKQNKHKCLKNNALQICFYFKCMATLTFL